MNLPKIPTWVDRAECRDVNPEMFFPSPGRNPRYALRICAGCAVKNECLTLALEAEGGSARQSRFGIYGGFTPDQRAQMRTAS